MFNPYDQIGGRQAVLELAERFYDIMEQTEPALTALHQLDEQGRISRRSRDRFALFLVGWLGGPQDYIAENGHPRLRMRHARVAVNIAMRDAWLRCMERAMDDRGVAGELRAFLSPRFAEVADFMRNVEE
ncbi:MAG TPA: group II truncated hemoglobin [Polyangiaceae bacterium]|jgi:hemoglobin|nr:group II truncated hemoglobin [Polyangiaceae bacterium]